MSQGDSQQYQDDTRQMCTARLTANLAQAAAHMGTYSITENQSDSIKFRALVSFNEHEPEYWEHDSLAPDEIHTALQNTADMNLPTSESIEIPINEDGQIITE